MPYQIRCESYVPAPEPVHSDYLIGCHYFPGWKPGAHQGFAAIHDFPERTPLIGYYDESLPEVTDWEIKWAVEHGIGCFIYCWYRNNDNVGKPVTRADLRLPHAIYEGLYRARYKDKIRFAIMWEAGNCGEAKDADDLCRHLLPFWAEEYFSQPNYLKFGNKPVLFVYDYDLKVLNAFGSPEKTREALERCSEEARQYGFDGIHFQVEYRYDDPALLQKHRDSGYAQTFAYCWHTRQQFPTQQEMIGEQMRLMAIRLAFDPYFTMLTCSQGWDPYPWKKTDAERAACSRWKLTPANWRLLLERVKGLADSMPRDSVGSRFIMLDNWNEWSEGHYLAPHLSGGFQYLQAVREVFTHRDNLPDYRLPEAVGLGPYDTGIPKPPAR